MLAKCVVCGGEGARLFKAGQYWIRECPPCRHRFAECEVGPDHTRSLYSDEYFTGGGAGYRNYLLEAGTLIAQGRRYGRLLAKFHQPGSLLDVGCAAGFLAEGLRQTGWFPMGVEPNAAMATLAESRFGFHVINAPLEDASLEASSLDAVTLVQVLPHLTNLSEAMRCIARSLRPGGLCLVETWDYQSVTARLFGRRWHEYSPPTVLQYFSRSSLAAFGASFGLVALKSGRANKGICGDHVRSLLEHKAGPGVARLFSWLPDSASIPYPGDDAFWSVFRKGELPGHR